MDPDDTMSIPMHTTGRGGRTSGLEILLTGAAIGLSVYTLMKLNTLEEQVRSMSKDNSRGASYRTSRVQFPRRDSEEEVEEPPQRVPPRLSPSPARENDYRTSEDEESDEEESPPPEVEQHIVEVVQPPAVENHNRRRKS